ncbi:MAG: hypothetical protein R6W89_08485, partial [Candidatus Hydrogenedentota bacterium]
MTKKTRYFLPFALMLLLGFGLIGCEAEEEEDDDEEEPPPPTAGEIERALVQIWEPTSLEIDEGRREELLEEVRQTRAEYQATPHGPEGIQRAIRDLEDRVRRAEEQELWSWVIFAVQALKTLDHGHSRFHRLRERAEIQMRRPE